MKEGLVNRQRPLIAHRQLAEVAEPGRGTPQGPSSSIAAQRPTVSRRRLAPVLPMRDDQLNAALRRLLSQRVAVVTAVGNQAKRLLPGTAGPMPSPHSHRGKCWFDVGDLRRGRSVKVVFQRKTLAVYHHALSALAPLGFADCEAPSLAGGKMPSINDLLHFNYCRSFNSSRKARQIASQIPSSSRSRTRRHQVVGWENSSGRPCQRVPLRKIHKIPSRTLWSEMGCWPPRNRVDRWGSKGRPLSLWASVSNRPYLVIGPRSGPVDVRAPPPQQDNYSNSASCTGFYNAF
jgi:hypothetical protein